MSEKLEKLRKELESINLSLLDLLSKRAGVVTEVQKVKEELDLPLFDPVREQEMLKQVTEKNEGPFQDDTVVHLFKEIFRASADLMESRWEKVLKISRACRDTDLVFDVRGQSVGREPILIAGPCSVESEDQMDRVGRELKRLGIGFLRGGTYKPRSSPYAFQGMKKEGLRILKATAERYGFATVTEVTDTRLVEQVSNYADILQVGARNMHNYELLKEVGRSKKPVLLKRGFSATLDEFLWAAEYVFLEGNERLILCERGIRTFERETRNTLDISAIPLLRRKSFLPVIADVSHAAGRKDILAALGKAALAAGANGIMVEVHPYPPVARSDSQQQLDFVQFERFLKEIGFIEGWQSRKGRSEQ